jgi:hypothetical protein
MPAFDSAETHVSRRAHSASEAPIVISQDDTRQDPAGHRVLYVLGFGIAGAIFANAVIFAYVSLFYVSG